MVKNAKVIVQKWLKDNAILDVAERREILAGLAYLFENGDSEDKFDEEYEEFSKKWNTKEPKIIRYLDQHIIGDFKRKASLWVLKKVGLNRKEIGETLLLLQITHDTRLRKCNFGRCRDYK